MALVLLGVDFRRAPLDVRAGLSYGDPAVTHLLRSTRDIGGLHEAVVLSTCNRTEFYLVTAPGSGAADAFLHRLRRDRADARPDEAVCALVRQEGAEAAAHLFSVAAGMDSALLGDGHIAGQVKRAYALACAAGSVGPVLHHTFQQALHVARRVRRETTLGHGQVSIGSVVRQIVAADARHRRVSIVGTGEVATDVARHLAKQGRWSLTVVSRDPGRAASVAAHVGAVPVGRDAVEEWLAGADVVIGATMTSSPLITASMLSSLPRRPWLVCDLGVPRNVAVDLPVPVLSIDDIQARRDAALALREAAVPAAAALVRAAAGDWDRWRRERAVVPTIASWYAREQQRRHAALVRLAGQPAAVMRDVATRLRLEGRRRIHARVKALRAGLTHVTPETRQEVHS